MNERDTMKSRTILIIDDDPIIGEIMKDRLEAAHYTVRWERDGLSGLAAMQSDPHPALVLLDLVMPNMNGYELLERAKADPLTVNIPVLVVSNSGQPVEIERLLALGAKDYVAKAHFSPEEVLEKVERCIGTDDTGTSGGNLGHDPKTTKLLIVEDEPLLAEISSDRFKHAGYQVLVATDGTGALEVARREKPHLMLLDLVMPGMSGFEVLRQMKQDPELAKIPVVICSNLAQENEIKDAMHLGAIDYFVKSDYTPSQLIRKVQEVLAKI